MTPAVVPVPTNTVSAGTRRILPPVGLDTVGVRAPLKGLSEWMQEQIAGLPEVGPGERPPKRKGTRTVDGVTLTWYFYDGLPYANWECSLPRLRYGVNSRLLSVDDALSDLRAIFDAFSEHVEWAVPFEEVTVYRLDINRHFEVGEHISDLLWGLHRQPLKKKTDRSKFSHHGQTGAHFLSVECPSRWAAKLYDKAHEQRDVLRNKWVSERVNQLIRASLPALEGTLRYELKLSTESLKEKTLRTIGNLSESLVEEVAREYFETFARFGTPVGTRADAHRRVAAALTSKDRKWVAKVLGLPVLDLLGLKPANTPDTIRIHRNYLDEWGLNATMFHDDNTPLLRLDWELGCVVVGSERPDGLVDVDPSGEPGHEPRPVSLKAMAHASSSMPGRACRSHLAHALEGSR